MLKTFSETLFSLVFPLFCELCDTLLPSRDPKGICQICRNGISLIAPPHCAGCGRSVRRDGARCERCLKEKFHFDRAYACVYYDEKMKKLLHAFKFERRRFLLPLFADILGKFVEQSLFKTPWDLVVPVPMEGRHERERGFNQARLFSAAISKKSGKPHAPQALGCRKAETPQSFLKKSERKRNAEKRFFTHNRRIIASKHILLVDDIMTTGQTASACAKALKDAGALTVSALALARGI
jgi:ComF family protein